MNSIVTENRVLPGIGSLQISGKAFPGQEIQACGFSINGTTSVDFKWVRYSEDGSVNYIDGATKPCYVVTTDDVGSVLAVEALPLNKDKHKGEIVKAFANEGKKITSGI